MVEQLFSLADQAEKLARRAPTILIIAVVVVIVVVAYGALKTARPADKPKF